MITKKILQFTLACLILALLALIPTSQAQNNFDLTLTWSTDSYVPPNYAGKPLPTQGSRITVVTLVNQPPDPLKFSWKLDGAWQNFASGLGRQTFSFIATQWPGYSHRVYLELSYPGVEGDNILAEASLDIPIKEPEIHFYKINQTKLWPDLVNGFDGKVHLLAGTQTRLIGLPYFFNVSKPQDLAYAWYLASEKTSLTDASRPQIFDLEITSRTQPGIKRELMLKCSHKKNLSERTTVKLDIIVD